MSPTSKRMPILLVPLLLAASSSALPQGLSCDDVEFEPSAVEEFPTVAESCDSVVDRSGKLYVRLVAEVIRARDDGSASVYLKGPDGTRHRQEFKPPAGFRAMISGKPTPIRDLRRGQEIHIYLPASQWRVVDDAGSQ